MSPQSVNSQPVSPQPVSPHSADRDRVGPDPEAAVTRSWSGRLLDAGLRQHGAAPEPPHPADSPSPQPSCPPEDAR
ncbi:hypothetical protein AB0O31_02020 [Kitasatospora cineracea]|uniref:hypothetical protein n=1 Tax=Kitasatospora cineracea TaxID=88074 RepID=UPI0034378101